MTVVVQHTLQRDVTAFIAGVALAGAFAPFGFWPLAIISPAILIWLWQGATPRDAARYGFWFNTGTFAVGTYWLYTSIHTFGNAPIWMALMLMALLVVIMGLYQALLGYVIARWTPQTGLLRWLVAVPAAWLLLEWWRGWFLTGFSWLSLGYSQTDTWLASIAPMLGVYGISAVLLISAGAVVALMLGDKRARIVAAVILVLPWGTSALLKRVEWTHESGKPVTVAIVQGAIPQDLKWLESNREATYAIYHKLNTEALGASIIVWPEAALPELANNLVEYIRTLYSESRAKGSTIVMGAVRQDDNGVDYYNSILSLSDDIQWYDKHHLVPFSEFFPVPDAVRSMLRVMDLPYADFKRGTTTQPPLKAAGLSLGASICYEDAYGSSQLFALKNSDALVNVTNDAWFGRSTARHQHFQISRMRAIEAGRYLLRAANDGISGVIGPHGEIVARAVEYEPTVLRAVITPRTGVPPYVIVGNWFIIGFAAAALIVAVLVDRLAARRRVSRPAEPPPKSEVYGQ